MLFEIDDGYNLPTKSGFIIRPVTRAEIEQLREVTKDFDVESRARAFWMLAKKSIVVGRLPEADEDAVHEILTRYEHGMQVLDEANLSDGVKLALQYPHLAKTTCAQCKMYSYSPLTGQTLKDPETGAPLLRMRDEPLTCEVWDAARKNNTTSGVMPPKCPKGHHVSELRLSDRNQKALQHWQNVMLYGGAPNDTTWLRNAKIIEQAGASVGQHSYEYYKAHEGDVMYTTSGVKSVSDPFFGGMWVKVEESPLKTKWQAVRR
jgi:hypothetical protein